MICLLFKLVTTSADDTVSPGSENPPDCRPASQGVEFHHGYRRVAAAATPQVYNAEIPPSPAARPRTFHERGGSASAPTSPQPNASLG